MEKIIIIGIDGMDRELIKKYIDYLPNFRKIIENSPKLEMKSVFPPDSDTAWASIYTGLNPAKHGIVDFADPIERAKITHKEIEYLDSSFIQGKTFWDLASKKGKRCCIIYPHIAYPIWDINGFMINPNPSTEKFEYTPKNFEFGFDNKELLVQKRIPRTKLEFNKYIKKKEKVIKNEFEFANKMLEKENWNIFFLYSSALDSIMHIFWNYCDKNDPTYPGHNQFENVIRDFHILYDELIGELIHNVKEDVPIMFLSDHGHSMRPVNLININEILRKKNYLFAVQGAKAPIYNYTEKIKRFIADFAQKSGLRPAAMSILRMFPQIKGMYSSPSTINFSKTIAHGTDLSGLKSYSYGGIRIIKSNIQDGNEYESIRSEIISFLKEFDNYDNNPVFDWICRREELYEGKYIEKYPDIVFNLKHGFGAGWGINLPIFTKSISHKFYPGSHRGETPILYLLNFQDKDLVIPNISLMDIAPTILDIIGIKNSQTRMDGKNIFSKTFNYTNN